MSTRPTNSKVEFFDLKPELPDVQKEVCQGLRQEQKMIAPKYFYDERGSHLFSIISHLPDYYLTAAEMSILNEHKLAMAHAAGPNAWLLEYGVGSGDKSRILINAMKPQAYLALDISQDQLHEITQRIALEFVDTAVYSICVDYTKKFDIPLQMNSANRVAFFPGSSIGNFSRPKAKQFLKVVGEVTGSDSLLILGVDRRKDKDLIEKAYNDSRGVTAMFNRNILSHLNRRIGADFDINLFHHHAFYDEDEGRIEMHLVSQSNQTVSVGTETFQFDEGETIHTEDSYKYSVEELEELAAAGGYSCESVYSDNRHLFSVALLRNNS